MKTSLFAAAALIGSAAARKGSELAQADHFVIKAAEPHHIHAEFHDLGYRNKQNGEKSAETLFYDVATGEELFQLTVGEFSSTVQYLDHEPITFKGHHGQKTKEAMLQLEQDGTAYARALGRQALHAHPSFASSIARMAIAVGQRGIYGNSHPAAYYLYTQGVKFEQARRGEHVDTTLAAQATEEASISLLEVEAEETEKEAGEEGWGGVGGVVGTTRRRRRRRKKQTGAKSFHGFFNNKNMLYSHLARCTGGYGYPGNERRARCFGVCGPGCECWIFICGRCDRIYQGCTEHDCICMDKCEGSMKGSPTDSNNSGNGVNSTAFGELGGCNMLNAYQDWGSYRGFAQIMCVYSTQHWWWGDGDCKQMPLTSATWTGTQLGVTSQWANRIWVWGVGGHYPGLVGQFKKKARKFSYFLEYNDDFSVPNNWTNSNNGWWTGNSPAPVGLGPVTQGDYYGQGYTYNESGWGIGNHQDWLAASDVHVGEDFIFVKPYGFQFFPDNTALNALGYNVFQKNAISSSASQATEWPGCGIDASRLVSGWTTMVSNWEAINNDSWTEDGHHGYSQPVGDGGYNGNDSNHNLWYYSNGDEKETSKDRWIYGGEGNANYQADWNTLQTAQGLEGNYSSMPPKKKYGTQSWFSDVLYNGSFAAVVGDQFTPQGNPGGRPSGGGCLKHAWGDLPTFSPTTAAPTKHPTTAAPTKLPTRYPTPFPTTSPTENPNWGDCCVLSTIGLQLMWASAYWQSQYPATDPNSWIHPGADCTAMPNEVTCLTKVVFHGWVGTPENYHQTNDGCEWIPMGAPGNHKCPHEAPGIDDWGVGFVPNSLDTGTVKLPTAHHPVFEIVQEGKGGADTGVVPTGPAGVEFALQNDYNVNIMGVTLPAGANGNSGLDLTSNGRLIEDVSLLDGSYIGNAFVRDNDGRNGESSGPSDGRPMPRDVGGRDNDGDHEAVERDAPRTRLEQTVDEAAHKWIDSGEQNYPFYIGSDDGVVDKRLFPALETGKGGKVDNPYQSRQNAASRLG